MCLFCLRMECGFLFVNLTHTLKEYRSISMISNISEIRDISPQFSILSFLLRLVESSNVWKFSDKPLTQVFSTQIPDYERRFLRDFSFHKLPHIYCQSALEFMFERDP